jgi:hypothetical protein
LETWMSFNFGCNKRHGDILMGISWGYFDGWYGMTFSQLKNLRMPYQYHPIKKKKHHQNRSKWQTINHNQALACAKQSQDTCRSRFGILRLGSFPSPTAGISWEGEISIRIGIG